jgi:hypothetical protein
MDQPWTEDSVSRTLINPNYCLTDPPVATEKKWIEVNARLVQETGAESSLATLLSVLRAGSKCTQASRIWRRRTCCGMCSGPHHEVRCSV